MHVSVNNGSQNSSVLCGEVLCHHAHSLSGIKYIEMIFDIILSVHI